MTYNADLGAHPPPKTGVASRSFRSCPKQFVCAQFGRVRELSWVFDSSSRAVWMRFAMLIKKSDLTHLHFPNRRFSQELHCRFKHTLCTPKLRKTLFCKVRYREGCFEPVSFTSPPPPLPVPTSGGKTVLAVLNAFVMLRQHPRKQSSL